MEKPLKLGISWKIDALLYFHMQTCTKARMVTIYYRQWVKVGGACCPPRRRSCCDMYGFCYNLHNASHCSRALFVCIDLLLVFILWSSFITLIDVTVDDFVSATTDDRFLFTTNMNLFILTFCNISMNWRFLFQLKKWKHISLLIAGYFN